MARDLLRAEEARSAPPTDGGGFAPLAAAAPPRRQERAPGPEAASAGDLVVDDEATPGAGQLRRRDLMAQIRAAVRGAVDRELAIAQRSTEGCPYIDFWLSYYEGQPAGQLERAIRRYAPDAASATSAAQYAEAVAARAARATARWAKTGEMSAPELGGGESPAEPPPMSFAARPGGATPRDPQLGAGQPLETATRGRMERALGHDFSAVRIHADDRGARAAADMNAHAFTVGRDIGFAAGTYAPGTPHGDALLGHELGHVMQQAGATTPAGAESAAHEHAADLAAAQVLGALPPSSAPVPRSGLHLQRCGPTIPRGENLGFGALQVVADSARRGPSDVTQTEFEALQRAWTRVNDGLGGLIINGTPTDRQQMIAILGREMLRSRAFRDLIVEITEDSARPVTINAGRTNISFTVVDDFPSRNVDLEAHELLDIDPPAAAPWAVTQGEAVIHWLAERRFAATHPVTDGPERGRPRREFEAAHPAAEGADGFQHRYRRDRGQTGRSRSVETPTVRDDGVIESSWVDGAGNSTVLLMDGAVPPPLVFAVEYRPAGGGAAVRGRAMALEATVTGPAGGAAHVRFIAGERRVTTADTPIGSAGTVPMREVVPTGAELTVEVEQGGTVVLSAPWPRPFRPTTLSSGAWRVALRRVAGPAG